MSVKQCHNPFGRWFIMVLPTLFLCIPGGTHAQPVANLANIFLKRRGVLGTL